MGHKCVAHCVMTQCAVAVVDDGDNTCCIFIIDLKNMKNVVYIALKNLYI